MHGLIEKRKRKMRKKEKEEEGKGNSLALENLKRMNDWLSHPSFLLEGKKKEKTKAKIDHHLSGLGDDRDPTNFFVFAFQYTSRSVFVSYLSHKYGIPLAIVAKKRTVHSRSQENILEEYTAFQSRYLTLARSLARSLYCRV